MAPETDDDGGEPSYTRSVSVFDGMHNAVHSNPDLREVYKEAINEHGLDEPRAFEYAYRAVHGDDYWEEEYAERVAVELADSDGEATKAALTTGEYEKADDALLEAHENLVQWNAGQHVSEMDLNKAPGTWESQDEVPDFVLDTLERLIRSGSVVWGGGYERLPPGGEAVIMALLEDKLTQPQGWSLQSLLDDLDDHYPEVDDDYLLNILRNETSAVLNTAREEAFESSEGPGEEFEYDWVGPDDWRTTDTCLSIQERIEDEGGSVPMPQLKEILYEEALAHQDREGTPERVDDWQPHYQCRRTFVRRVA